MGAKHKTEPIPTIDVGLVHVGSAVGFWDERRDRWRFGRVLKITDKYFSVSCNGKTKRIPADERLYLIENGKMFNAIETP